MDQHFAKALRVSLLQLAYVAGSRECHPVAGLREVHHTQTNEERDRGDNLKVKQRLQTFFKSPPPAIPTTRVEKISGAMIDLMRFRKMSRRK